MYNFIKVSLLLIAASCFSGTINANSIKLNQNNFILKGESAKFIQYKGQNSIFLKNASATIKALNFTNGTIEYDIAFKQQRGFLGVEFRKQKNNNSEEFYIRPHQSGNPDANQYTPVFNGLSAWQLYHRGFAGKVNYHFNTWNHIKIVVAENKGEVYVNDMKKPAFTISEFLHPNKHGEVSFYSNIADSYITNIKVSNQYSLLSQPETNDKTNPQNQYINQWHISNSFHKKTIEDNVKLTNKLLNDFTWQSLTADSYGIVNLAKVQGVSKEKNTVFAKTIINAEQDKLAPLQFGYSDKVQVYLNGKLLYKGDNSFRSRDYRYLGTIGLFDQLYLPLQQGENELVFAVSERFGGWGLTATLAND